MKVVSVCCPWRRSTRGSVTITKVTGLNYGYWNDVRLIHTVENGVARQLAETRINLCFFTFVFFVCLFRLSIIHNYWANMHLDYFLTSWWLRSYTPAFTSISLPVDWVIRMHLLCIVVMDGSITCFERDLQRFSAARACNQCINIYMIPPTYVGITFVLTAICNEAEHQILRTTWCNLILHESKLA